MSFFRKLGRAIDPTSKSSPLGGIVRAGVGFIPGGGAIMAAVDQGARVASDLKRSTPTDRGVATAPLLAAPPYAPSMALTTTGSPTSPLATEPFTVASLLRNRTGLAVIAAVVAVALAALFLRRK